MAMTDMDRVRLKIGDNVAPMHFSDAEIWELINQEGSWQLAAAECCFIWARWLGRQPDFTIGRFSESGNHEAARLLNEKGMELLKFASAAQAAAFAGGISVSDKATREGDTDRVQSRITRGFMDNPNA